jgi:hypothetical protein
LANIDKVPASDAIKADPQGYLDGNRSDTDSSQSGAEVPRMSGPGNPDDGPPPPADDGPPPPDTDDRPPSTVLPEQGKLPPVVIGEHQSRVEYASEMFDAESYKGRPAEPNDQPRGSAELERLELAHNEAWLRGAIADGRLVIDTGAAEHRVDYPNPTRGAHGEGVDSDRTYHNEAPYEMERRVSEGYDMAIRPYEDMSRVPWQDTQGKWHVKTLDEAARAGLRDRGIDTDTVDERPWIFTDRTMADEVLVDSPATTTTDSPASAGVTDPVNARIVDDGSAPPDAIDDGVRPTEEQMDRANPDPLNDTSNRDETTRLTEHASDKADARPAPETPDPLIDRLNRDEIPVLRTQVADFTESMKTQVADFTESMKTQVADFTESMKTQLANFTKSIKDRAWEAEFSLAEAVSTHKSDVKETELEIALIPVVEALPPEFQAAYKIMSVAKNLYDSRAEIADAGAILVQGLDKGVEKLAASLDNVVENHRETAVQGLSSMGHDSSSVELALSMQDIAEQEIIRKESEHKGLNDHARSERARSRITYTVQRGSRPVLGQRSRTR